MWETTGNKQLMKIKLNELKNPIEVMWEPKRIVFVFVFHADSLPCHSTQIKINWQSIFFYNTLQQQEFYSDFYSNEITLKKRENLSPHPTAAIKKKTNCLRYRCVNHCHWQRRTLEDHAVQNIQPIKHQRAEIN